jgi:RNA polymerase sigma factor (sigma-70 family)
MKNYNSLSDKELIRLYVNGEEKAFEFLLEKYQSKIYTSIYMFVKDRDLANDIFQETFIKIIDTFRQKKYNEEGKFVQWAQRIAYNLCVDYFRKNKRRNIIAPRDDFDIFDLLPEDGINEEERMERSQTYSKLKKLVRSLPSEQREVIMLRHFAELSFKEIAELTDVSINTALGRMRYALINIRKLISDHQISLH